MSQTPPATAVDVSVIILACNEEQNIAFAVRCAVPFARNVFVVDSGSSDRTIDIARQEGATVVSHGWEGYAAQRVWAIRNLPIDTSWILFLDADETVDEAFWDELRGIIAGDAAGADLGLVVVFGGAVISHGPTGGVRLLRAFRKDKVDIPLRALNEHAEVDGRVVQMRSTIDHHNRNGFARWAAKHWRYASMESAALWADATTEEPPVDEGARQRWRKRRMFAWSPPFVRSAVWFAHRMLLQKGYLDGTRGLAFHTAQGLIYPMVIDAWFVGRAPGKLLRMLCSRGVR